MSGYLGIGTGASTSYRLRVNGNEYHSGGSNYLYHTYNYLYGTYNYLGNNTSSSRNYLYSRYNYIGSTGTYDSYNYLQGLYTYINTSYTYLNSSTSYTRHLLPYYNNNSYLGSYYNRWYVGYVTYMYRYYEYSLSDRRVKENIRDVQSPLAKITGLQGRIYDLNESHPVFDNKEKSDVKEELYKNQYGYIAQEVMEVVPEMVEYDEEHDLYMIRNYEQLFPIITEAMKEQQEIIKSQEDKLDALIRRIEALEAE